MLVGHSDTDPAETNPGEFPGWGELGPHKVVLGDSGRGEQFGILTEFEFREFGIRSDSYC